MATTRVSSFFMQLNLEIPDSLFKRLNAIAEKENLNNMIKIALYNQLSHMDKLALKEKASKGNWNDFCDVLAKVSG